MSILVHDKPDERPSWAPHGSKGYYLGPALKHHKSWRTFIVATQKCRNTDSVAWFPRPYKLPGSDPHAMVKASIDDLAIAMRLLALSDKIGPATRQLILDHTAVATSELRAVVDMYSPSLSHNHADPDDSLIVADPDAQRVVPNGPPSHPSDVPTVPPAVPSAVPTVPSTVPSDAPTAPAAPTTTAVRRGRKVTFPDNPGTAGWSADPTVTTSRRDRKRKPPPTPASGQRVSPDPPLDPPSVPHPLLHRQRHREPHSVPVGVQRVPMISPSAPSSATTTEPTALASELHPTRLGPPAVSWAADAPLLGRGRRSKRARSN
jgi:hypothetical protein